MADFLNECQTYFGTKNLYEVFDLTKEASENDIKKSYRKKSLIYHPDRVPESRKQNATKTFQVLAKVYHVLSNKESRETYDKTGMIVLDGDLFSDKSTFEDFQDYWRTIFPKINTKKLDKFAEEYIGSTEEKEDLKKLYERFAGDLNKIYEYHFFYDEDRVTQALNEMIENGEIEAFDAFTKEKKESKLKRLKRIQKEEKLAEKESKKLNTNNGKSDDDLIKAIQLRGAQRQNDLISKLEAKYGKNNKQQQEKPNKKRRNC